MKTPGKKNNVRRLLLSSIMLGLLGTSCVKSNLDNAFDPQFPLGLIIGLNLSSGGGSSSSSGAGGPCRYDQSNFDNCTFSD